MNSLNFGFSFSVVWKQYTTGKTNIAIPEQVGQNKRKLFQTHTDIY